MPNPYLVDQRSAETVDVLGPTVRFLTPVDGDAGAPCALRGSVPPGGFVPVHKHADPETFIPVSGELQALVGAEWIAIGPGDVLHIPPDARHAFRNDGDEPAVMTIVTTARIAQFFRAVAAGPPEAILERFLALSVRYGYWNATPAENAAVGLDVG
jgi:quercetin dioxygenase-like cupin family protein